MYPRTTISTASGVSLRTTSTLGSGTSRMWFGATSLVRSNQKTVRRFKSSPLNGTVVSTLDEALADCVDVVMTTGRETPGAISPADAAARLLDRGEPVALVFGDEVRGLTNRDLARAGAVTTIPTAAKSSLNLAQAVMV